VARSFTEPDPDGWAGSNWSAPGDCVDQLRVWLCASFFTHTHSRRLRRHRRKQFRSGVVYDRNFSKHQAFTFANDTLTLLAGDQSHPYGIRAEVIWLLGESSVLLGYSLWTLDRRTRQECPSGRFVVPFRRPELISTERQEILSRSLLDLGTDGQHGNLAVPNHILGNTTHEQMG